MRPVTPVLPDGYYSASLERVYAKDQPEYNPLPALVSKSGMVTTRWKLTLRERLKVLLTGNVYLQQLTYHAPLQPQRPTVDQPKFQEAYNDR